MSPSHGRSRPPRRPARDRDGGLWVLGGTARGVELAAPPPGPTRPYLALAREALMNALAPHLPGARVLDLYAGTGALGIEALSRGAARAVFVERDPDVAALLAENLARCRLGAAARIIAGDAVAVAEGLREAFDLVFCDPPFALASAWRDGGGAEAEGKRLADALAARTAPGGRAALRVEARDPAPKLPGLAPVRDRTYGRSRVVLYGRVEPA